MKFSKQVKMSTEVESKRLVESIAHIMTRIDNQSKAQEPGETRRQSIETTRTLNGTVPRKTSRNSDDSKDHK